jgi:hypothetical protein
MSRRRIKHATKQDLLRWEILRNPMCAVFRTLIGRYEVQYPAGYWIDGVCATYGDSVSEKLTALRAIIRSMGSITKHR